MVIDSTFSSREDEQAEYVRHLEHARAELGLLIQCSALSLTQNEDGSFTLTTEWVKG